MLTNAVVLSAQLAEYALVISRLAIIVGVIKTPTNRIIFLPCPRGYCCNKQSTAYSTYNTCTRGRKGTFCRSCDARFRLNSFNNTCVEKLESVINVIFILCFITYSLLYTIFGMYQKLKVISKESCYPYKLLKRTSKRLSCLAVVKNHLNRLSSCLFFSVFSVFSVFLETFCFFLFFDFFSVFSVFFFRKCLLFFFYTPNLR